MLSTLYTHMLRVYVYMYDVSTHVHIYR